MMPSLVKGAYWLILPYLVATLRFQSHHLFSPTAIATHVDGLNWNEKYGVVQNLEDPEDDDDYILNSVVDSMRSYSKLLLYKRNNRRRKRSEEVVCYKDLGCFRDTGAFDYLDILPSSPEEVDTRFIFYNRRSGDSAFTHVYAEGKQLKVDTFNGSADTKIIVHGFGSSCTRLWVHDIRSALLKMMDCNVICVDWSRGAATPNYMRAAANTQLVGRQIAVVIKQLINRYGSVVDQFHLIGFSLGAHVSGFTGKELNGTISRITGLDPAGPLFEGYPPIARLDPGDAKFVDVIHSNGDSLLRGGLGTYEQLGHVDFYPNGGRMQKGCTNLFIGAFSDLIWSSSGNGRSLCNHRRSYRFFIDSISPICLFPAMQCENYDKLLSGECFPCIDRKQCGNMGYYADKSEARGKLYLITREGEPFCANQKKVSVSGTRGTEGPTYGRVEITLVAGPNINETFPLTSGDSDEINRNINRILVAHPAIVQVNQIQLLYVAYNGWLYSGAQIWSVDRVILTDSYGNTVSYCSRNTILRSGKPKLLKMTPGLCRVSSLRPTPNFWNQDSVEAGKEISENLIEHHRTVNSDDVERPAHPQTDVFRFPAVATGNIIPTRSTFIADNEHLVDSDELLPNIRGDTVTTEKIQSSHESTDSKDFIPILRDKGQQWQHIVGKINKTNRGSNYISMISQKQHHYYFDSTATRFVTNSEELHRTSQLGGPLIGVAITNNNRTSDTSDQLSSSAMPNSIVTDILVARESKSFAKVPASISTDQSPPVGNRTHMLTSSNTSGRGYSEHDPHWSGKNSLVRTYPSYYLQYLPSELFADVRPDHVPGPKIQPPFTRNSHYSLSPQHSPSSASPAKADRSRPVLRFSFIRNLLPDWQTPQRKYIPTKDRPVVEPENVRWGR